MDVGKLHQIIDVIKRRGHALILLEHDVRAQWSTTAPDASTSRPARPRDLNPDVSTVLEDWSVSALEK
jgi:hypothetical protein